MGGLFFSFNYLHIAMAVRFFYILILSNIFSSYSIAQQLGGNTVFSFMQQPNSAQLSALGGVNISNISNDVSLSFHNPSLLRPEMDQQLNTSFNSYFAGVRNYSLSSAFLLSKSKTSIAFGINYFDYGSLTQTDPAGNILGSFHPNDYVVQMMASHQYLEHWWYGMSFKFISSNYGQYKSNGIAVDAGLTYYDDDRSLQASFLIKNIGTQLKTYDGSPGKAEIPFDMQLGVTKRLENAPIQFSLTAQHLQAFNIYYNDTSLNNSNGNTAANTKSLTLDNIVSHFIFATQFFIKDEIEVTAGYNFLNRHDLNVYNSANGLNGFTFGLGVLLNKIHIRYATGFYQQNMFQQISLNFTWKGNELDKVSGF